MAHDPRHGFRLVQSHRLKGHNAAVLCCTGAGACLVSGAEDGRLLVHDLQSDSNAGASEASAETGTATRTGASARGPGVANTASATAAAAPTAAKPLLSLLLRGPRDEEAAVTAVAANPTSPETCVFAAASSLVHQVDLRAGSVVQTYDGSSEEVNGLCVSQRGSHLAAGDDAGEVQVYDLAAGRQFKGIRNAHRSICSSVAFRAHKPWDLLTGGLDSTVAKYDFSRPKCIDRWDMNALGSSSSGGGEGGGGQLFNPPFVHQVAVPPGDARPACQWVAAARGDGAVVVLDADVSSAASGSSGPTTQVAGAGRGAARGGGGGGKGGGNGGGRRGRTTAQPLVLDRDAGGHTRPVSSVAFAPPSEDCDSWPCRLFSAGEDSRIILWDVGAALEAKAEARPLVPPPTPSGNGSDAGGTSASQHDSTAGFASAPHDGGASASLQAGPESTTTEGNDEAGVSGQAVVLADVHHGRKVNQLCTLAVQGAELVAAAAVSKFVAVYRLHTDPVA